MAVLNKPVLFLKRKTVGQINGQPFFYLQAKV
jgi:hypothetical protein